MILLTGSRHALECCRGTEDEAVDEEVHEAAPQGNGCHEAKDQCNSQHHVQPRTSRADACGHQGKAHQGSGTQDLRKKLSAQQARKANNVTTNILNTKLQIGSP